jgi:glycosyltransferase involved in cell wall biosynthesis
VLPVSVTIIARNESANIAAALESVSWADEIVVVDAESTDDTVAIARRFTPRVTVREWPGYTAQKNFAAGQACHDWIFSLDADERVSPALAEDIRKVMQGEPREAGFRVPRASFYLGRWLRSTDWYPDFQLRLYDRRRARWEGRYVHETVAANGAVGKLRGELLHYPYRNIAHHVQTIDRYTTLIAEQAAERGRRASMGDLLVRPPIAFLRNYVLRLGIKDGRAGLVVSLLNSYYVFLKFAKLWERQHCSSSTSTPRKPGEADSSRRC